LSGGMYQSIPFAILPLTAHSRNVHCLGHNRTRPHPLPQCFGCTGPKCGRSAFQSAMVSVGCLRLLGRQRIPDLLPG
jgi:hypothetical protein